MANFEAPVFRCCDCGKQIADNELMWSVNVHLESADDAGVAVHQADCYKIFCEACGHRYDFKRIHIPRKHDDGRQPLCN